MIFAEARRLGIFLLANSLHRQFQVEDQGIGQTAPIWQRKRTEWKRQTTTEASVI